MHWEIIMSKENDENPFALLLEDMTKIGTQAPAKPNFNFGNLLKSNNKRGNDRHSTTGIVIVYNADGTGLSKAVLRDISPSGFGVEILPVPVTVNMKVLVELCGRGETLGRINCSITRVSNIEAHPKNHKAIGLKIEETNPEFKIMFEKFYKTLIQKKT